MEAPNRGHGSKRAVLYIMTAIMGGCGIAYEYTFSKISSDLMGNSVRQWAITIGLMMFFMGIGSDLQKYLKDKHLFDKFIFFEVVLGMLGGFGPILLLWVFGASRDHYVLVQYSLIVSTGFLIGLETPILVRINEQYTKELAVNIGGILRMDYIGAFAGAALWAFIFIGTFQLTQVGFILGVLNMITAALSLVYFSELAHRKGALALFVGACSLSLLVGLFKAPDWTRYTEQKLYMDRVIYSHSTKYQHIVLTQTNSGDIFCYINGNTQFSSYDEYIYHEFLVHPAMALAPSRKKVLVLGGGDGLGMREIVKYADVEEVTLVDLDPEMTRLARENPYLSELNQHSLADARIKVLENGALTDAEQRVIHPMDHTDIFARESEKGVAEVTVVNIDAGLFIDQIRGFYDVIIVDFPDPNNLELSKLYSMGFYSGLRAKLTRGGIIVQQATSPVHTREAFLCIGRTMKAAGLAVVPMHENVPVFGEWGWWIGGRKEDTSAAVMKKRLSELGDPSVPVRHLTGDVIRASQAFGKQQLITEETPVNTILNNVIYQYYRNDLAQGY